MRSWCAVLVLSVLAPFARADRAADINALMAALDIAELVDVMQQEGVDYAGEIADSMLAGGDQLWAVTVAQVYDADRMAAGVRDGLDAVLSDDDIGQALTFFQGPLGQRIVGLENSARRALLDPEIETIARASFTSLEGSDDARLALIDRFVVASDLIEINVAGGLKSNYMFYRGMVDGGALQLSDGEIRADVWQQENDMRTDTREWVYGFSLMAYQPLSDAEMRQYVVLSGSSAGRALNSALFKGFEVMYSSIAHALGMAVAQALAGQEL